ncbi:MAG: TonB-dependent receptor [Gammaproteobacteria bacterium]|jgi:iron complex outermembrane receptor protein|nr:TonB-dependent receptor [Gammaproteobacteria bacterium]
MRFRGLTALLLVATLADVQAAERERDFDIPPQALAAALERFIVQAGVDLLYDSTSIGERTTGGVSGRHLPGDALELLLSGTGLEGIAVGPDAFAVRASAMPKQEQEPGSFRLPGLLVTATRESISLRDAPAAVSVIDRQALRNGHATTLDQAVRSTPGAFARRSRGLMDTNSALSFRGFPGQRRTLIMIDGLPLNDPYTAEVNFPALDMDTVERVEIVRGPFSSLYGGNAMSGVVNVITAPVESSGATLHAGYGDAWNRGEAPADYTDLSFHARLKPAPAWGLSAGYRHRSTGGYPSWYIVRPWRQEGGEPTEVDIPAGITGAVDSRSNSGAPVSIIGDAGDNGYSDDTLSLKVSFVASPRHGFDLHHTRTRNRYTYGDPHSRLRDAAGGPVFAFAPGETPSGAISAALAESTFLAGGPGGTSQDIWRFGWRHQLGGMHGRLLLGHVDGGRNWFVSPDLRPRPGTEALYPAATRAGGRGLLSEAEASHMHVDYQFAVALGAHHTLTVGATWQDGRANNQETALRDWRDTGSQGEIRSRADGRITSTALFVQDRWDASARFTVYAGLRHDWWRTRDGSAYSYATVADAEGGFNDLELSYPSRAIGRLSPRLSAIYRAGEQTSYRAAVGHAFRGPTVFELYRSWFSPFSGTEFRSNPLLAPETSRSWEIGVDHQLPGGIGFSATWFHNEMKDFIYRLTVVDVSPVSSFHNAARASSRGVELGLHGRFGESIEWHANYTWTDAVIDEFRLAPDSSLIEGKQIVQFPKRLANLGVRWTHQRFTAGGEIRYADERYNTDANTDVVSGVFGSYDSPTLVDMDLGWQATQALRLSLAVENLLDREWYDFYRAPGRTWLLRMTLER